MEECALPIPAGFSMTHLVAVWGLEGFQLVYELLAEGSSICCCWTFIFVGKSEFSISSSVILMT